MICCENSKYAHDENFVVILLPNATLVYIDIGSVFLIVESTWSKQKWLSNGILDSWGSED